MISDINIELLTNEGYTEVEHIGQGSYGTVYKCKNKRNKLIAVKIPNENNVSDINEGLKEAFHLKGLKHENIVKVYNVMLLEIPKIITKLAIEMEYLNYGNLNNVILKKKINLSENLIYKILQQTCGALQYLEENEVVHRDLNLNNIVIKHFNQKKEEIEIVIIDFGFVKSINSEQSMSIRGTIGYLAPELLENNNNSLQYSFKSDIFALGVTLYRLMSFNNIDIGQFYRFENNIQKVKITLIENIKKNINVKYSDKLINLILKMLERDLIIRYNAEQILNEIKNSETNLIKDHNLQNINEENKLKNITENKLIKIDENYNEEQILNYVKTKNDNLIVNENLQNKIANNEKNLNKSLQNLKEDEFKIKNETKLIGFSNKFEFVKKIYSFKIFFKETKKGSFLNYLFGSGVIEQQVEKIETFKYPSDILIDNDLIYIVDKDNYENKRIVIFNLENNQFIKQFNLNFEPSCIKLDKTNDTLLIGDYYYNVIYRFNKNFELLQQFGNNNGNKSEYFSITGIEVDESNGNIFICNYNDGKVQILTKDFKLIKEFTNNLIGPWDILLNNEKNELIISDNWGHCIKIFTKDGQFIKSIGKYGNKESEFDCPSGFIYDIVNNQYIICDSTNFRIQIFNENFEFIKSFGKYGNGQNEFYWPINLAINYKTGQLYIVDTEEQLSPSSSSLSNSSTRRRRGSSILSPSSANRSNNNNQSFKSSPHNVVVSSNNDSLNNNNNSHNTEDFNSSHNSPFVVNFFHNNNEENKERRDSLVSSLDSNSIVNIDKPSLHDEEESTTTCSSSELLLPDSSFRPALVDSSHFKKNIPKLALPLNSYNNDHNASSSSVVAPLSGESSSSRKSSSGRRRRALQLNNKDVFEGNSNNRNNSNRNNMFYSPNRITMNKRFYEKKLMSRSLEDLQELSEWRRLLRERNVEEIQFRKTLQNKYRTDDYKVKDGYFVKKIDEYQQLKNLHKLYSIVNYNN